MARDEFIKNIKHVSIEDYGGKEFAKMMALISDSFTPDRYLDLDEESATKLMMFDALTFMKECVQKVLIK